MSETDDTDHLLRIAPDHFSIGSEQLPHEPFAILVDDLISHVNQLETRLNRIESNPDLLESAGVPSLPTCRSSSMPNVMKSSSWHDSSFGSTQSTPQKPPPTALNLHSLPSTPQSKSRPRTRPHKVRTLFPAPQHRETGAPPDLHNYLRHLDDGSSLGGSSGSCCPTTYSVEMGEIQHMLKEIEVKYRRNQARLKRNEDVLAKSGDGREAAKKVLTWQAGDGEDSVPDLGLGMRNVMYSPGKQQKTVSSVDPAKGKPNFVSDSSLQLETSSGDEGSSSESTQLTVFRKFERTERHIAERENPMLKGKEAVQKKRPRSPFTVTNHEQKIENLDKLSLMSLAELWNRTDKLTVSKNKCNATSGAEEERLRRQHCEQLVMELQAQRLELQQRLVVATEIDEAKNRAIAHLRNISEDAVCQMELLTNEIESQTREIEQLQAQLTHHKQKICQYEDESSKALDLANGSQEKLQILEKRNNDMADRLKEFNDKLKTVETNYHTEVERNDQLSSLLGKKEVELCETKKSLSDARKEITLGRKTIQTQLANLKVEYEKLQHQLEEQTAYSKKLEAEKWKFINELDSQRTLTKKLEDELKMEKDSLESNKLTLRDFYQNQVENVVREKLKEFQDQLEKEQTAMQDEISAKELTIARTAAIHIQELSQKHNLEVKLLEEKRKEEAKLFQLQFKKAEQQIEALTAKYQQYRTKRATLARQLHSVMEAQWLEALKIINNGKSPKTQAEKDTNAIDQLNSLKSRSFTNVDELLFDEDVRDEARKHVTSEKWLDGFGFVNNLIDHDSESIFSTPKAVKLDVNQVEIEKELEQFVQMLLNHSSKDSRVKRSVENNCEGAILESHSLTHDSTKSQGSKIGIKPPWK